MKYTEAMKRLQQRRLKNIYLIAGEETYLAEKFLSSLLSILGAGDDIQYFDNASDIESILQSLDSSPFFSEKNIIVAKNLKLFQSKLSEKDKKDEKLFMDYLSNIPDYSILILITTQKLDKRRKLLKLIDKTGILVECESLSYWNIGDWLNSRLRELNLRFDREAYAYFLEAVRSMDKISLGFLDQELQKLVLYTGTNTKSTSAEVINLTTLKEVLSSIPEISAFTLWDMLCAKNIASALELFAIQQQSGIHPLRLLSLLVRQVRQLWQIKVFLSKGQGSRQIAATLKLHPFITEKIIKQANNFSMERIEKTLHDLADADYKLKTGSDEPALIENIFIRFCQ